MWQVILYIEARNILNKTTKDDQEHDSYWYLPTPSLGLEIQQEVNV